MLGILWETVSVGAGVPILNIVAFIAGIAMSIGTCLMAAALFSTDD
jgi:hypothetical protein